MIVPSGKRKYQVSQGQCKNQTIYDDDIFKRLAVKQEESENKSPEEIEKADKEALKIEEALKNSNSQNFKQAIAPNLEEQENPQDLLGVPPEVQPGMPQKMDRGSRLTRSVEPQVDPQVQPEVPGQPVMQPGMEPEMEEPQVSRTQILEENREFVEQMLQDPNIGNIRVTPEGGVDAKKIDISDQMKKPVAKR